METLSNFISSIRDKPWSYRLKLKGKPLNHEWSNWLIQPSENYLETSTIGPCSLNEIEWIEINAIQIQRIGKLVPDKVIDHMKEIIELLKNLKIIFSEKDRFVQIETKIFRLET